VKIGGFQPLTLSDYPGQVAAIVFAQGCNFRCPFCHNAALLATEVPSGTWLDQSDILVALQSRRSLLNAVVLSGGEPTLQDNLMESMDRVKRMGLKVKLDTNGSRPAVLRDLLNQDLLDCVAMDIKAPLHKYPVLTGVNVSTARIQESIALLLDSGLPCQFRTTFVPGLLVQEDLEEIRSYLPSQARYNVQSFVRENAWDPMLRSDTMGPVPPETLTTGTIETNNLSQPTNVRSGE